MKQLKLLAAAIALTLTLSASSGEKVVYGVDNRVDVINSNNQMFIDLAASTAAMINSSSLQVSSSGADVEISGGSLTSRGICSSERFANQMSAANCSGFLVGEDLLVTAGHCVRSEYSCNTYSWVFDFKVYTEDQYEVSVAADKVYRCKEIITTVLDRRTMDDYALIRLDRKVKDRAPLRFRKSGKPSVGDDLVVIGHPTGLPTKIADGANIRSLEEKYFSANLDTYGGNSGSAVFNANTGVVEGILVRGATDYVSAPGQNCRISNVLADDAGRGEDVTYITNIQELMNL